MRFDEINILGDFKINGLTGGENQFMGLSGGGLFWLDASPNIEGFNVYGTNYILCNSFTYSATASGQSLRNAYASASTLSGISATNRAAILINPGIYDFDSEPLGLSLSYVDLVGVSPAASSVTLKASSAPYTIQYYEGVDSGLYNLGLTGGTTLGVLGSASTYLRWDNVFVSGFAFGDGTNYSFENLIGEFRNIYLEDNSVFGVAQSEINGIFDNIGGKNTTQLLYVNGSGNISGTFSNIEINTLGSIFITNGGGILTGDFENIHLDSINFFVNGVVQDARFENIKLKTANNDVFVGELINVDFSNFEVGQSTGEIFLNSVQGTFENIKIGSTTNRVFFGGGVGTFSNIYIGSCIHAFGSGAIGWTGSFTNIEIENFETVFYSAGSITGRFDNIRFGVCTESTIILFNSSSKLDIEIYGFELSDQDIVTTGTIFGGGIFSGTYNNIKIGNSNGVNVFYSDNSINGDFSNIEVGDCDNLFFLDIGGETVGYLDGNFHNIVAKNVSGDVFTTTGDTFLAGTYSDIEIKIENESGKCFNVNGSLLSGNFYNIKLVSFGNSVFTSTGDVNVKVKNLTTKNTQGIFNAGGNLYGEISNVVVDRISSDFFISGGDMIMVVDNFTIKSSNTLPPQAFSSVSTISGTYSNIYIYSDEVGIEYFYSTNLNGKYENLYLGTATTIFDTAINATFKNINAASYIPTLFVGKISDSYINATGLAQPAILINNDAIIDRCRFIADSGQYSIATTGPINSKISFLISNRAIDPQITNLIAGNKNIISSLVRSEPKY